MQSGQNVGPLTPIAPFKDKISVISGTDHRMATSLSPEESAGDHSRTAAVYWPGANAPAGNGRCVEAGTYDVFTQGGTKYVTHGYTTNTNPAALKRLLSGGAQLRVSEQ